MNYPSSGLTETAGERPASEQANNPVQQVSERAHDVAGSAQVKVRDEIDTRSTQAGEQVAAAAMAFRSGADELYRQGNASAGDAAQRAAAQAERLGSYLKSADADRILADAEDIARRNTWAVVVGGVVAGAAAARFLKASSSRRYASSSYSSSSSYAAAPRGSSSNGGAQ